jgi:hypothetical protein
MNYIIDLIFLGALHNKELSCHLVLLAQWSKGDHDGHDTSLGWGDKK